MSSGNRLHPGIRPVDEHPWIGSSGHHEIRGRGAKHLRGFSSHVGYRLYRVADRSADHDLRFLQRNMKEEERESGGLVTPVAIEDAFVLPGRPDDAGEPIGECDGSLVVPPLALAVQCPTPQAIKRLACTLRPMGG